MMDQDASPPPPTLGLQRAARLSSSPYRQTDTPDSTLLSTAAPSSPALELQGQTPQSNPDNRSHAENRLSAGVHRAHKHRSSGSFLLADPLLNRHNSSTRRTRDAQTHTPEKRQRRSIEQHTHKGTAAQHGPQRSSSRASSGSIQGAGPDLARPSGLPEESSASTTVTKRDSLAGDTAVGSSPSTSIAQLDMESAQIVNMALNLSESRRLASRRNISQPTPPRLAPLPDNAPGGSLRYHLQQQRKVSRTVSPRPDRSPRIPGGRVFTPLQPAFESGATYRYHFSQSTLARAQKAKEYLDLMAQYRRVLELVAPLEPDPTARTSWAATPPVTPNGSAPVSRVSSTNEPEAKIGRPYNPLQYVRNRKVRARERRTIDGEEQGFDDVMKVSDWIDDVAKWVATGQACLPGNPPLPPFTSAQTAALQASPPSTNPRTAAVTKPKRPRVDWVIDPADMLADVYWLELDDNKKLVEDRHWRRVFPQGLDIPRPISHDEMPRLATPGSANGSFEARTSSEKTTPDPPPPPKNEHEHVLSVARDRAQQKFRALKGSHHRHSSSVTNRDLLRLHRGSLSESSDTDSDRRRRTKGGVPASTVRSVLEKQMEEMIAQEQRTAESHPLYDHDAQRMKPAPMTPEREPLSFQDANTRQRADLHAEQSEAEVRGPRLKPLPLPRSPPPQTTGRTSLEVPGSRRFSVDDDTSRPNSPNMRPTRDIGLVPAIGLDLSPMSSRPSSPHRNPLTRVKSIFRDRSKERNPDAHPAGEDATSTLTSPPFESWIGTPDTAGSGVSSPQRRPSISPMGERILGHRAHKSLSGAKLRGEDGGISFRSLLRGPRIDTVLRSGVSKVSDMIWRKEGGGDDSSSTSSDDSDAESRGRSRRPRHGRSLSEQDGKNLLEAPQFMPDYATSGHLQHPPSRPISRRSSRFDLLKPPRIDVQNASPSTSPPPVLVRQHDPVGSDTESQPDRDAIRAAAARLDAALTLPHGPATSSRHRQWSLNARSTPPTHLVSVSKREIARLRALLLSTGVHAMEMDRRANTRKLLPTPAIPTAAAQSNRPNPPKPLLTWQGIAGLAPDTATQQRLLTTPLAQTDIYPIAASTLASSIQTSTSHFNSLSSRFSSETAPTLLYRVESLRNKVAGELTDLTRAAADAADEASHDLVVGQRLKVKRVVDAMDKLSRRRRRRFRWVRRAGWLVVEWVLVGCMWYVWFLVMIARVVTGLGRGVVRGVRWLLWL
ncbi:hypothetical protein C8A00DRAFT_15440 [Chaetomidium leptoderma]|uniref:Uncharacterized protein n=1 Tax=Chaetomidium leptoderma TaxID=669021 RepID=A0AAN6ZYA5_9PEZI|nr:hypothetical protein C8A00DRAFT_15440 [Chaetomidium leptoderma]